MKVIDASGASMQLCAGHIAKCRGAMTMCALVAKSEYELLSSFKMMVILHVNHLRVLS